MGLRPTLMTAAADGQAVAALAGVFALYRGRSCGSCIARRLHGYAVCQVKHGVASSRQMICYEFYGFLRLARW